MSNLNFIHQAIRELYPAADERSLARDYSWITLDPAQGPVMQSWDKAKLGPLDMAAIEAKCDEIASRGASIPEIISDRQFAHGLWKQNVITYDEAKAFVTVGVIPTDMQALISQMPAAQRQDAELLISGSKEFHRHHPTTIALAEAFGWTPEVTDEFWRFASTL